MKLLVDECVDRLVAQGLTDAGHDLLRLPVRLHATDDIHIAAYAIEVSRIVLTQDYDFGEIAVRPGWALPGVLLLACQSMPMPERIRRIVAAAGGPDDEYLGHLTIVEPRRTRRRAL